MKKILTLIAFTFLAFNSFGQSFLTDTTKFQVKVLSIGYEAVLPLQCGDGETIKNTPVAFLLAKTAASLNEKMLQIPTYQKLNILAKYNCKNKFSWKPSKITIYQLSSSITAMVEGSAENAYGSRGEVTYNFILKNGEFVRF